MKELKEIGKKVRKIREERGITLAEVAMKTGRSVSFLRDVEAGRARTLTIGQLAKICDALGGLKVEVSLEYPRRYDVSLPLLAR